MWTCPKCASRWNGNKLRCDCGRKQPKRRPTQRDMVASISYEALVAEHGERCMICGAEPGARRLHRDHDHKSGRGRGLLCFRCNAALRTYMTAEWLRSAADYLERARV